MKFIDLCLYLEEEKVLVFGDIHLGYEASLHNKGSLIPKIQYSKTVSKLKKIFETVKINTIVINGDLKHEFGTILKDEWKEICNFIDFLRLNCKRVILIKGNHDNILYPIAIRKNVELCSFIKFKEIFICHGDSVDFSFDKIKTIVIGHEHPAITIKEYPRDEKYKCFLIGNYKKKRLIVMPSFNVLSEGTDILQGNFLSPFISNVENFKVKVVGEKRIFGFGKVKDVRKLK